MQMYIRYCRGSSVVSPQCLVNLHQLDVNFWQLNNVLWASNEQTIYWNGFFDSKDFALQSSMLGAWCDEDVMIHYNKDNNAYCWAVNAKNISGKKA